MNGHTPGPLNEQEFVEVLAELRRRGYIEIDEQGRVWPTAKGQRRDEPTAALRDLRGSRLSAAFETSAAALRRLRGEEGAP